ncbi:hypothetical protein GCM10010317_051590 [Streptomyces mirabilis]|uniref:hypothetical protein n=1 Tax=Streptomyces mirabilis TaxID=68239 RepID=UPI00167E5539|nr:hypothetical protein [Streptomyces mirabilis]GHD60011.1 hypothetical protein GCM10010317_051590 [Streptomyces mirabilis]
MADDAIESRQQDQTASQEPLQANPVQSGAPTHNIASLADEAARTRLQLDRDRIAGLAAAMQPLAAAAAGLQLDRDRIAGLAAAMQPLAAAAAGLQLDRDRIAGLAAAVQPLAAAAARLSVNPYALDSLQRVASRSWLQEMRAASPLLHGHFEQSVLNLVDTSLQGLDDLTQDTDGVEIVAGDLPDETLHEIEDALSGFEHAVRGLPPAIARRLWISWVQLVVFALCLQALILLPNVAEVTALAGTGALALAQQAGLAATSIWDKQHPSPDSDTSEEA